MNVFMEDSLEAELLDEVDKAPTFTRQHLRYLESRFNTNKLLSADTEAKSGSSPETHLGYLRGIREVMDHIGSVYREQQFKES